MAEKAKHDGIKEISNSYSSWNYNENTHSKSIKDEKHTILNTTVA